MEVCSNSVADIVSAVVNGADGCLFGYGHSHLGESPLSSFLVKYLTAVHWHQPVLVW